MFRRTNYLLCCGQREPPPIRKPYYIAAFKLLQEFGFEVSERTVREGDTMCTLRVLGPTQAQPDPILLESMAMRYRHDFGLLDSKHQAAILITMRQLWEEVAGVGFYRAP